MLPLPPSADLASALQLSLKLEDHALSAPLSTRAPEVLAALQPTMARRREVQAKVQALSKSLRRLSQISAGLSKELLWPHAILADNA